MLCGHQFAPKQDIATKPLVDQIRLNITYVYDDSCANVFYVCE